MHKTYKTAFLLSACLLGFPGFLLTSAEAQQYGQPPYGQVSPSAPSSYQPYEQVPSSAPSNSQQYGQPSYGQVSPSASVSSKSALPAYASASNFFSPINDRIISDPMFLPLKGQIYGVTAYAGSINKSSNYNYLGTKTVDNNGYNNTFTQTLAYGLSDVVTLRLAQSYAFGNTDTDNQKTSATSTYNSIGLEDPTLSFTYRFIDQRHNNPVSADFYAAYAPNMLTARDSSSTRTGSEASGRQTGAFQADVGRVTKGFTIEGLIGGTYEGRKDFVYLSDNENGTAGGFWAYYGGIYTQTRLNDRWSINGDVRDTFVGKTNVTNQTTGLTAVDTNPDSLDFTAAVNYHFIPNRLVGQFSYDNIIYTHTAYNYTILKDNYEVKNDDSNVLAVRLLYLFN